MADPLQQVNAWIATYSAPEAAVADLLCERHHDDAPALTEVNADLSWREMTFGELAWSARRLAGGLAALGVGRGDRVATVMGPGCDLAVVALATWWLGAVHVPLFTAFAPSVIALRLADASAAVVVCDGAQHDKLDLLDRDRAGAPQVVLSGLTAEQPRGAPTVAGLIAAAEPAGAPVAVGPDAALALVYTSSASGTPTAVQVPVRALAALHCFHHFGLDVTDDDVYWNTTDPAVSFGLFFGLISPLLAGHHSLVLRAGFDPELTLEVMESFGVTNLAASPTIYRALRSTLKTLPPEIALRRLASAEEPLHEDVVEWAHDVFGVAIHDHYNQTELGVCLGQASHPDAAVARKPGSMGRALPGWRVTVLDALDDVEAAPGVVGRVAVDVAHSPLMWFTGYHNATAASLRRFSPDGYWYLTGDTASRDTDGDLFFASRDSGLIVTSGYRVGPFDVESALVAHPAVAEAAVYGVPDEMRGQIVAAEVVLAEGVTASNELAEELRRTVRTRFAEHADPRQLRFVTELPRTPSGKIRRPRARSASSHG
ncbi:AMP-binding protein [Salinactinospora qingdaonensis]|uniref:Acyl-CoA synthetase n=1 Tax=Salinactinospora qingdaonensis TaxID=702744 RepID=A0ABP7GIB3_9ACTN